MGDVNLDGHPHVAVGAPHVDTSGVSSNARVIDGALNGDGTDHMLSGRELPLSADAHLLSRSGGGVQTFYLSAPDANAGQFYLLLGSVSGTTPGTPIPGTALALPLNADAYFALTLAQSVGPLGSPFGVLDPGGGAFADLAVAAGALPPSAVGLTLHHAYLAIDAGPVPAVTLVSDAVPTTVID